jgi:hypothetical protein
LTRINLVPVETLTRLHLIAEYTELPRVFGLVRAAQERGETPASIRKRAPTAYTLGTGHALFFYDKLGWLVARYNELVEEMRKRGYNPNFPDLTDKLDGIWLQWYGERWIPSPEEIAISQARIDDRVANPVGRQRKEAKAKSGKQEWDFEL